MKTQFGKIVWSGVGLVVMLALCTGASATSLAPGGAVTCGIDPGGTTRCWGYGKDGALGDGTTLSRSAPVATLAQDLVMVATGNDHACGLTSSGLVRCWGANDHGQLGDGTTIDSAEPRDVVGLSGTVTSLALGVDHSCALIQDGSVECWGASGSGRLGDGSTSDQTSPHPVLALGTAAIAIGAGDKHTCALLSDHGVKCWGDNGYGQIGDGSYTDRATAVAVAITGSVNAIAVGGYHTCALLSGGGVQCWGDNYDGQLGDRTNTTRNLPASVFELGPNSGVRMIAAGSYHSCALLASRRIECWGNNSRGELGDGSSTNSNRPVSVSTLGGITQLSAGGQHTCALNASGRPYCWGYDQYGEIGFAAGYYVSTPAQVSALPSLVAKISLFDQTSCAITTRGAAMCWGDNSYGQIGDGSEDSQGHPISHNGPRKVAGLGSGVRDIAVGEHHACAVTSSGKVWCWGDNSYGQVGDGTTITRTTPVQVPGVDSAVAIATGGYHSCALTSSGAVLCWGLNDNGQLGDGSTENHNTPVTPVGLDAGIVAIAMGDYHSCAVSADGQAFCWGDNVVGQLGDGSQTDRHVPTAVADTDDYVQLSGGTYHTCGLTTQGAAKCWGYDRHGQVGDGGSQNSVRKTPAIVDGLGSNVSAIAAAGEHSCVVQNGELKCWGWNAYYQLGDGTQANRYLPVAATTVDGPVTNVALGYGRTCTLMATGPAGCFGYNYFSGALGNGASGSDARYQITPSEIAKWLFTDVIFSNGFEPK